MVLLDDVVQVFVLAYQDVNTGIGLDTFNGRRIGTALVDGDLLGQAVQVDGALQKTPGRCLVPLSSQQKVDGVASAVNRALKVLPLTRHFDVSLVHPPTTTNRTFASTKDCSHHRQYLQRPAMYGGVVNENAALLHHFFDMSQAQRVRHIPAHAGQHDFQRAVKPMQKLVQGAVNKALAQIKHGQDCCLCFRRQNLD